MNREMGEPKVLHEWTADHTKYRIFVDLDGDVMAEAFDQNDDEWMTFDEPALVDELMNQKDQVAALTQRLADARRALVILFRNPMQPHADLGPEAFANWNKDREHVTKELALARSSAQAAQPGRDRQPDEYVPAPEGKKSLFPDEDAAYRKAQAAQPGRDGNG